MGNCTRIQQPALGFWVSNNDDDNPYHFEPLGDPMGIVAVLDGEPLSAAGPILGAEFNIYAADLGTDVASNR